MKTPTRVLTCAELGREWLIALLERYGLRVEWTPSRMRNSGQLLGRLRSGVDRRLPVGQGRYPGAFSIT